MMSDGETIVIGTVDEIQKLHIRTVSLGESVRRVVHQPETSTMAILVSHPVVGDPSESSFVITVAHTSDSGLRSLLGVEDGHSEVV